MQSVKLSVIQLLGILKTNREAHHQVFIDALTGYRELAIAALELSLQHAKAGKKIRQSIQLEEPANQTKAYDTVIRMLELTTEADVVLTHREFKQYVMDEWDWMDQFVMSNTRYVSSENSKTYMASKASEE